MNKLQTILAAAVIGAFSLPAFSQAPATAPSTPNLDKREANQQRRIDEGVKSGQLTPQEATRLQKRQDRLTANEARAKADGVVTNKERAHLQAEANRNSRVIAHEKHDRQHVKK